MTILQTALSTVSQPSRLPAGVQQAEMTFLPFVKWGFLLFFLLYVVFAFIITRQIAVMKNTLQTNFSGVLQTLGYIHLAVAILIFVIFFIVL